VPEFTALIEGYHRFRDGDYRSQKLRFDALAEGQSPPIMVISCCDSRVDPATIFDTEPGQVFALRNVANLVPPYLQSPGYHGAAAAIEFAVLGLNVKHIVVLGHGRCGGIRAALEGGDLGAPGRSFVDDWMDLVSDARADVIASAPVDPQRALEWAAIRVSLANLRTYPYIAQSETEGRLKLHGAWFAIAEGALLVLNEQSGEFLASASE
jgi:carbonic anhydrase